MKCVKVKMIVCVLIVFNFLIVLNLIVVNIKTFSWRFRTLPFGLNTEKAMPENVQWLTPNAKFHIFFEEHLDVYNKFQMLS